MTESASSLQGSVASGLVRSRRVDVTPCTECGACSDVCPVAFAMDTPPAELMTRARKGEGQGLLFFSSPWVCTDCRKCSGACPVGIDVARAMEGFRLLAHEKNLAPAEDPVVELHRLFLQEVGERGRLHELSFLWRFRHAVPEWRSRLGLPAVLLGRGKLSFRVSRPRSWSGLEEHHAESVQEGVES